MQIYRGWEDRKNKKKGQRKIKVQTDQSEKANIKQQINYGSRSERKTVLLLHNQLT